jgi:hypothetical protein
MIIIYKTKQEGQDFNLRMHPNSMVGKSIQSTSQKESSRKQKECKTGLT